jgi:predicted permease
LEANRHDVDADYESRSRTDRSYILVGRLDPSFTRHAAEAELSVLLRQEDMQFPIYKDARNIILTRVSMVPGDMRSAVQNSVRFLHVIAAFVLIIACANISGLFIARSAEREREIAIRVALGAPRAQLLWHVLLECLIVSFLSAVLGIILTFWSSRALLALLPSSLFLSLRLSVNGDVILFVLLLSLVSTLLFGVPIALHYAHVSPGRDLKQAPDTGKTRARTLRTLVIVQISVALILVGAANISFQALDKSIKSYPGFPNRNIVAATFAPGLENTSDHRTRSQLSDVAQQLSALPEIQAVATAEHLPFDPMRSNASISILAPGYSYSSPTSSRSSVAYNIVGPGYFELLGIAILKGRGFTHADEQQTLQVAIVNQVMADRFWKGDAIGQHINLDIPGSTGLQIVGVAQNGRYDSAKGVPQSYLYLPVSQTSFRRMTVLARTRSSPDDAVPAIRELLKVGSGLPLLSVTTLDSALDYVFLVPRACSVIFGFFAGLAFVLSNAGLYALISFTTERRTREIGVRLALGTPRERIATLVLAQALRLSVVGVVAGGIPTLLVIRVLSNMFYGGQGTDLKGLAITVSVVTLTSLIAALVPAVRAAKVDPVEALRYE